MDYDLVADVLSCASCSECHACFPTLAKYCDEPEHRSCTTCKELILQYLNERTKDL